MFQTAVDKFPNTAIKIVGRYSSGTCLTAVGSGPCTWRQTTLGAGTYVHFQERVSDRTMGRKKKQLLAHLLSTPFPFLSVSVTGKGRHAPLRHNRRDDLLQRCGREWRSSAGGLSWSARVKEKEKLMGAEQAITWSINFLFSLSRK